MAGSNEIQATKGLVYRTEDVHALGEHIDRFIAVRALDTDGEADAWLAWQFYAVDVDDHTLRAIALLRGVKIGGVQQDSREKGHRHPLRYEYITKGDV